MEERKKRPPINLSDMEDNKPGPERGSLGFAGVDRKESSGEGKKKVNLSQILLPVVIALALSALIMFQYAPSKTFLVSQVKVATDSAAALTTQLGSERGRIDAIVNSMGTYAKKTELDTYAKASQLSGLATTSQLSGYATTAQLAGYTTKEYVDASINATKAYVASNSTRLEYSLSYNNGLYLKVKSAGAGTFIGKVILISPSVSVGTNVTNAAGGVVGIEFLTGSFTLEAGVERSILINTPREVTYSQAYIEVLPGAGVGTGGGI